MKNIVDISKTLKKLLFIVLTVMLLGACGDGDEELVTKNSCNSVETCEECRKSGESCTDLRDTTCLGCEIFEVIYESVGTNVMKLHTQFSKASMAIVMIGFAIWLMLRILKFASSVNETNVGEVWNEILRKVFVCLICGILASNPTMLKYAINTLVMPIYTAFLELGLQILEQATSQGGGSSESFTVFGDTITVASSNLKCELAGDSIAVTDRGFPESLKNAMACMIRSLTDYLTLGGSISYKIMSHTEGAGLIAVIVAFITWACFWVVKIGFVFYLVDTLFQMGIIILLLPLFIISYAFGPTRKWATSGFKHMLASAAFLMCFSVIVAVVLMAMVGLVQNNPSIFNPEGGDNAFRDISIGFICLLLIGFLIYGSMGVSQQLTSAFIGIKMSANFQKNLKAVVQAARNMLMAAVGGILSFGTSLIPQSKFVMIRQVANRAKALRNKLDRVAGRDKQDID